ncbi:MAG: PIN domain-containing protein [Acidobacteriaceae bacterium]|jgi:predicted nucleic acid-binding protein
MAAFVDTNILLYALSRANSLEVEKVAVAKALIAELSKRTNLRLSAQVSSEFVTNAIRKGTPPLTLREASEIVDELSRETVLPIDASLVQLALQRVQQSRLNYWDALIVEAAIRSGASVLYTEDMHHGARYGSTEMRNPFLP